VGFYKLINIGLFTHLPSHFYHFTQKATKVTKNLGIPNEYLQGLEQQNLLPPRPSKYLHPTLHFHSLFIHFHEKLELKPLFFNSSLCIFGLP
jgi:hypothetical protein